MNNNKQPTRAENLLSVATTHREQCDQYDEIYLMVTGRGAQTGYIRISQEELAEITKIIRKND